MDWYLDVLRKYKDKLLDITRYIVADAWFSKAKFVNEACLLGFHVISRLRDDAALWYSHNGVRTGKRGRPRIKGEKIDFEKLDLQRCELLDMEGGRAYSVKAYSKAMSVGQALSRVMTKAQEKLNPEKSPMGISIFIKYWWKRPGVQQEQKTVGS